MTLNQYKECALERLNPTIANKDQESMRFCCMGLLEEAGEVVSELRKPLYKGNFHEKPLNKDALKEELGDLIWYIALTCRNNNINMNKVDTNIEESSIGFNREKIIKRGIKLGRQSGIVAKRYIQYHKREIKKEKLEKSIRKQYKNILKISNMLGIQVDDILKSNIEKVNGRYDKNGCANIQGEEEDER